jgi:hypothetical protein
MYNPNAQESAVEQRDVRGPLLSCRRRETYQGSDRCAAEYSHFTPLQPDGAAVSTTGAPLWKLSTIAYPHICDSPAELSRGMSLKMHNESLEQHAC